MSEIPFNQPLIESDHSEKLWGPASLMEFKDNPNWIIRFIPFEESSDEDDEQALPKNFQGVTDSVETTKRVKELFQELENKYGIRVPLEVIIAKNEKNQEGAYSVTKHVMGQRLEEVRIQGLEKEYFLEEVHKLLQGLLNYYIDISISKKYFLTDVTRIGQFVYGKIGNEEVSHIYLIDTDLNNYTNFNDEAGFFGSLASLANTITVLEKKLQYRFDDIRKNFQKLLTTLEESSGTKELTKIIDMYLNPSS